MVIKPLPNVQVLLVAPRKVTSKQSMKQPFREAGQMVQHP